MFECPALQGLRDRYILIYENMFQAPDDAMILFMWQDNIIGADACLERVYTSAGPPWWRTRHLISPELAWLENMY